MDHKRSVGFIVEIGFNSKPFQDNFGEIICTVNYCQSTKWNYALELIFRYFYWNMYCISIISLAIIIYCDTIHTAKGTLSLWSNNTCWTSLWRQWSSSWASLWWQWSGSFTVDIAFVMAHFLQTYKWPLMLWSVDSGQKSFILGSA